MTLLPDLTLGQYLPGTSFVHRLDPRVKVVVCLLGVWATFWPGRPWAFATGWPLLALGVGLSRTPFRRFLRGFRPFCWLLALTLALHGLTTPGASLWPFPLGPVNFTTDGLVRGATISAQLATGVGFSSLLALTTNPVRLVWAVECLASPLKRLGLPVGQFCLSLLAALRLLPILREESRRLAETRPRGGGIAARIRGLRPFVVQLLRRVWERGDEGTLVGGLTWNDGPSPGGRFGFAEGVTLLLSVATVVGAAALPSTGPLAPGFGP